MWKEKKRDVNSKILKNTSKILSISLSVIFQIKEIQQCQHYQLCVLRENSVNRFMRKEKNKQQNLETKTSKILSIPMVDVTEHMFLK